MQEVRIQSEAGERLSSVIIIVVIIIMIIMIIMINTMNTMMGTHRHAMVGLNEAKSRLALWVGGKLDHLAPCKAKYQILTMLSIKYF